MLNRLTTVVFDTSLVQSTNEGDGIKPVRNVGTRELRKVTHLLSYIGSEGRFCAISANTCASRGYHRQSVANNEAGMQEWRVCV